MVVVPFVAMFCAACLSVWLAAAMDVVCSARRIVGVVLIMTSLNWGFFALASNTWAFPIPMGAIIVAPVCAAPSVVYFVATVHSSMSKCSKTLARQVFYQIGTIFLSVVFIIIFPFFRMLMKRSGPSAEPALAVVWTIVKYVFKKTSRIMVHKSRRPDFAPIAVFVIDGLASLSVNFLFLDVSGLQTVVVLVLLDVFENLVTMIRLMFVFQKYVMHRRWRTRVQPLRSVTR